MVTILEIDTARGKVHLNIPKDDYSICGVISLSYAGQRKPVFLY